MLRPWLQLYYTPHIGPARFQQLLDYFGSAELAVNADDHKWQEAKITARAISARHTSLDQKVDSALAWLESNPAHAIITLDNPNYPTLLKKSSNPPPLLFIKGDETILNDPQIAIVGTRHPTDEGKRNSYQFAKELSGLGLTITSGLAMGIDGTAHRGAVDNGGKTIAVLGTGLERIYPKRHQSLSESIIDTGGALVSEFPLHTPPRAENFPRRNRIIAGLALGTLVVEATKRSGSLITARLSLENNREVFSIPSSIHNPQAKGTHHLIRQGAKLTESALDIMEEFKGWIASSAITQEGDNALGTSNTFEPDNFQQQSLAIESSNATKAKRYIEKQQQMPSNPDHHPLYQLLIKPKTVDDLVNQLDISSAEVSNILLMLELEDLIKNIGANRYLQKHLPY